MKTKILIILWFLVFLYYIFSPSRIYSPIVLGSGAVFKDKKLILVDNAELPVLVIGDTEINPRFRVSNVLVENVIINGNMRNQKYEILGNAFDGIRNSGIVIRAADNVTIRNCVVFNCRSGGIVMEKGCKNILIENCELYANFFDGVAGCEGTNIKIVNCNLHSNYGAGLSFDWQFNDVEIINTVFHHNDTAVFIRDSKNISFKQIKMLDNRRFGWYIIRRDDDYTSTPENITFFEIEDDSPNTLINLKEK